MSLSWNDLVARLAGRPQDELLRVITGPHLIDADRGGLLLPVRKREGTPFPGLITLGRAADSDIVLGDPAVSRFHAFLHKVGPTWRVSDPGSSNGTFVDSMRVRPGGLPLPSGARLCLGGSTYLVFLEQEELIEQLMAAEDGQQLAA